MFVYLRLKKPADQTICIMHAFYMRH